MPLGAAWGSWIAREHRWYLVFSVCFVLYFSCVEKPKTPVLSCDLVALLEPSEGPLEALWGHSWGTVSAYPFNMLKKPESSATAEKQCPAVGVWGQGETLSKQVYLGRVTSMAHLTPQT